MMLQDKKIDKDDILKYCEITIDVVTGVFHWLMKRYDANPEKCQYIALYVLLLHTISSSQKASKKQKSPKKIRGDSCNEYQVGDGNAQI